MTYGVAEHSYKSVRHVQSPPNYRSQAEAVTEKYSPVAGAGNVLAPHLGRAGSEELSRSSHLEGILDAKTLNDCMIVYSWFSGHC